jgi:hypothetical protein
LPIKTKIVSCHTTDSKPVKQEVNSTILPPLVFPAQCHTNLSFKAAKNDRKKFVGCFVNTNSVFYQFFRETLPFGGFENGTIENSLIAISRKKVKGFLLKN